MAYTFMLHAHAIQTMSNDEVKNLHNGKKWSACEHHGLSLQYYSD